MRYVDGFLLPVRKKNLQPYRRMGASTARLSIGMYQ